MANHNIRDHTSVTQTSTHIGNGRTRTHGGIKGGSVSMAVRHVRQGGSVYELTDSRYFAVVCLGDEKYLVLLLFCQAANHMEVLRRKILVNEDDRHIQRPNFAIRVARCA